MLKYSHFLSETEFGLSAIPLFGTADAAFEKCASSGLLPDVVKYISALRPRADAQYVLVNAMGAGEYFGSNVNGDYFTEASLIHRPDSWTGNPLLDKIVAKTWSYGYPTFYNAHPYAHHRNKDATRAFGEVELATWNARMHRVELVTRVDKDKCMAFGGQGVWDKLQMGQYPDVSMGTKVPFDTCSICLDWQSYEAAKQTFDPARHTSPGQAILEQHKKKKIRGVSITRADYCEHAKRDMNRIYPDGRKVFVYNDYPRFFDISFVFIGADRTAKVMLFVHRNGSTYSAKPSADIAQDLGVSDPEEEKTASVDEEMLKVAFGKVAGPKYGEIDKRVVPSQFAGKAVPVLTRGEPDLPKELLGLMGKLPLEESLSTAGGMGIVLRPREFQRVALARLGLPDLADKLENEGKVFSKSETSDPVELSSKHYLPSLAQLLAPLLSMRSALGPVIEKRVIVILARPKEKSDVPTSHSSELLDKIGSAYNGYRQSLMNFVAHTQDLLSSAPQASELHKLGSAPVDEIFTPLSVAYLQSAFLDEFGVEKFANRNGLRGEGLPLQRTRG